MFTVLQKECCAVDCTYSFAKCVLQNCKVSVCAFSFENSVSGFAISINSFRNCAIRITVRV